MTQKAHYVLPHQRIGANSPEAAGVKLLQELNHTAKNGGKLNLAGYRTLFMIVARSHRASPPSHTGRRAF
jgi:hypothetical protein